MVDPARPRLLHVCAVDFTARHFLLPLMRAQRDWGFDVDLACSPGDDADALRDEGFPPHWIRIERSFNAVAHLRAYRQLKRFIADRQYVAVHLHTPVASLIGRPAARRAETPLVLYTAHGFYFHDAMPAWQRRAHVALERWAQRSADFLMTQSAEDAETAAREGIEKKERIEAIGNGVDLRKFRPDLLTDAERAAFRAELGLEPGTGPVVAILGRIVREKGYLEFAEAWVRAVKQHPSARALVIGQALESDRDNALARIQSRLRDAGVEPTVKFLGYRDDVPRILAASDLFVLPSWREGLPRSILEAMAAGLPVLATDIRGSREEVVDGETGFLVPPRDPDRLAERLTQLLADPDLRRRMGEAGRRRAEQLFDERLVIAKQEAIYRRLFEERNLAWPRTASGLPH